jgi:hypothetical protein
MLNENVIVIVTANATDKKINERAKPNEIFLFKGNHPLHLVFISQNTYTSGDGR